MPVGNLVQSRQRLGAIACDFQVRKAASKIVDLAMVTVIEFSDFFCHLLDCNCNFFAKVVACELYPTVLISRIKLVAFADLVG